MPSADMITRSVLSKRTNHHHPFFNAICFLLHLQGFRPAVQEEHVLNGTGQRCDITISFQDGPLPSSGIFRTICRHMILEFKSFHYPLDENAFSQISGYAETYALSLAGRKQVAPLLTLAVFGFTMMQWFQAAFSRKYELVKCESGIYDVRRYTRHDLRCVLIEELIGVEHACLSLLGKDPTSENVNILVDLIDLMAKKGDEEAVAYGEEFLRYVLQKKPDLADQIQAQGGKQNTMLHNRLAEMFLKAEQRNDELVDENTGLVQSLTEKNQTISELKKAIAFCRQHLSDKDVAMLAHAMKQAGFSMNLFL